MGQGVGQVRRRIEVGSFWRPGRTRCCFGVLGEDREEVHCRGRDVRRSRGPQGGRDRWPQASLGHLGERDCACAVFPQAQEFPRRLASVSPALLSTVLAQLASHLASAIHSRNPFGKVKDLISDMISKLEASADADATEKAYCDKELKETNEKNADKTSEIEKQTTRINQAAAKSAKLKEEVATLEAELAGLAKSQAEMDKLRAEEKAAFEESSAELEKGLSGIKAALKVLNEYYAKEDKSHDAADGAGSGIISLLEVCEADFSKNLAQVTTDEEMAVAEYEKETKENEIEKTTKSQDVKYKAKESKELDKYAAEVKSDRSGVQDELDAVLEYLAKIEKRCIAVAETYEDRAARREAEIAGLKQALDILESETALVQSSRKHRSFRGASQA